MDTSEYTFNTLELLQGKTFSKVERVADVNVSMYRNYGNEGIIFTEASTGKRYALTHHQDCCESVNIEDITGDLSDLEGEPLLQAEEAVHSPDRKDYYDESQTWTFYKFATRKGYVTVRFLGESNGYYSESVDLVPLYEV